MMRSLRDEVRDAVIGFFAPYGILRRLLSVETRVRQLENAQKDNAELVRLTAGLMDLLVVNGDLELEDWTKLCLLTKRNTRVFLDYPRRLAAMSARETNSSSQEARDET